MDVPCAGQGFSPFSATATKSSWVPRFPIFWLPTRLCLTFSLNVFQYFSDHTLELSTKSTANFSTWPIHFWPTPTTPHTPALCPPTQIWFCFFFAPTFSWFSCPATRIELTCSAQLIAYSECKQYSDWFRAISGWGSQNYSGISPFLLHFLQSGQ